MGKGDFFGFSFFLFVMPPSTILIDRYGRYTVATLESQLEGQQKEIARLKKALERSDQYIKELEHQIQCSQGSIKHSTPKRSHKKSNTDSKKEKLHLSQTNSKLSQKSVQEDSVSVDIKNPVISIKNEINQQNRGVISGQSVARQLFGGGRDDDYATFDRMKQAEKLDEKHHLSRDCHVQNVQGEPVQLRDERYSNGLTHISRTDRGLVKDFKSFTGNAAPEKLRTDEINRTNHSVPENGKISLDSRELSGVPKYQKGNFHSQTSTQSWHTSDRHPNIQQLFKEEEDLLAKQNERSDRSRKAFETQDFDSMYNGICKKYGLNPKIDHHAKEKERTVLDREIPESIMKKPELSGNCDFRERSPGKRVQFDLNEEKSEETSFDLEMPSPLTSSTSIGKVSIDSGDVSVDVLPSHMPLSVNAHHLHSSKVSENDTKSATSELCKRDVHNLPAIVSEQLSKNEVSYPSEVYVHSQRTSLERKKIENVETDLLQMSSSQGQSSEFQSSSVLSGPDVSTPQSLTDYTSERSQASQSFNKTKRESGSFDLEGPGLDDTQTIQTELSDLDISMTPELTDCMKLLNRAERKVYQSDPSDFGKHQGGFEASHVPGPLHVSMPRTYIAGTANVLSGWEHGFFSSLKVNPYRHNTMSQQPAGYHYGNTVGNGSDWTNSLMGNGGISTTRVDANQTSDLKQAYNGSVQSCLPHLQAAGQSLAEKLFALPVDNDGKRVRPFKISNVDQFFLNFKI